MPAVALLLSLPGTSSAAPFEDLPFRPLSGAAVCLVVAWIVFDAASRELSPGGRPRGPAAPFGNPQASGADEARSAQVAVTATGEAVLVFAGDRAVYVAAGLRARRSARRAGCW